MGEVFRLRETEHDVRNCDDAAGRNPSVGKGFAFFDGLRRIRAKTNNLCPEKE